MAFENLDLAKVKKLFLEGKSAKDIAVELKDVSLTSAVKRAIQAMRTTAGANGVTLTKTEEATRKPPSKVTTALASKKLVDDTKIDQAKKLVDKITELTKDPKNNTFDKVYKALIKDPEFSKSPKNIQFKFLETVNIDGKPTKVFRIPRDFQIYGDRWGKRKSREQITGLKELIGTKIFENRKVNGFKEIADEMEKFYTDPNYKLSDKNKALIKEFNNDFSITRTSDRGNARSISTRFFKNLNIDLDRKVNEVNKIWTTKEGLTKLIDDPTTSASARATFIKERAANDKIYRGVLESLKNKYPGIFKKGAAAGTMQLEHRIARSLKDSNILKLPKDYVARASYVPGEFNKSKFELFDKPLTKLIQEYNQSGRADKLRIREEILKLQKDFNTRSGGFIDNLSLNLGDKNNIKLPKRISIKDSTALFSELSNRDVLANTVKNIESSNAFYGSYGSERLKGMSKGKIASDFIVKGNEFDRLKNLVVEMGKTNSDNICQLIRTKGKDGGRMGFAKGGNCAGQISDAFDENPKKFAQTVNKTEGLAPRLKNMATGFLTALKAPGGFKGKVALGAGAVIGGFGGGALVKQFRNDDPSTYLTNEGQMEGMLISDVEEAGRKVEDNPILNNQFKLEALAAAGITAPIAKGVYNTQRFGTPQLLETPMELDQEMKTLKKTIRQITHPGGKKAKRIGAAAQETIRMARQRMAELNKYIVETTDPLISSGKGPIRSALGLSGVLGKGLWAFTSPIVALPSTAMYIAKDKMEGKSTTDALTNPLTYLGPAFMNQSVKALAKAGASRGLLAIASAGLAGTAAAPLLPAISIGAGIAAAGSLGYQAYKKFFDKTTDEDFFNR